MTKEMSGSSVIEQRLIMFLKMLINKAQALDFAENTLQGLLKANTPGAAQTILHCSGSANAYVRCAAARNLPEVATKANMDKVLEALGGLVQNDAVGYVRVAAATAIQELAVRKSQELADAANKQAATSLLQILQTKLDSEANPHVVTAIIGAFPKLAKALPENASKVLKKLLEVGINSYRYNTSVAIEELVEAMPTKENLNVLLGALSVNLAEKPRLREAMTGRGSYIGTVKKMSVKLLKSALTKGTNVLNCLLQIVKEQQDTNKRSIIVSILVGLAENAPEENAEVISKGLRKAACDDAAEVRRVAITGLGLVKNPKILQQELETLLSTRSERDTEEVRLVVVSALRKLVKAAPQYAKDARDALIEATKDSDSKVRKAAKEALEVVNKVISGQAASESKKRE